MNFIINRVDFFYYLYKYANATIRRSILLQYVYLLMLSILLNRFLILILNVNILLLIFVA